MPIWITFLKYVGALLTVGAAIYSFLAFKKNENHRRVILMGWLLLPPIFFYFEYFFQAPYLSPKELERFKDLQSRASQIWAGVSAGLALIYFKARDSSSMEQKMPNKAPEPTTMAVTPRAIERVSK